MGKIESVVYSCDVCDEKSILSMGKCRICGKDMCDNCSYEIGLRIVRIQKNWFDNTTNLTLNPQKDLINHNFPICKECDEKQEEIFYICIGFLKEKKASSFIVSGPDD